MPLLIFALSTLFAAASDASSAPAKSNDALTKSESSAEDFALNREGYGWAAGLMLSLSKSKSPRDWALLSQVISHNKDIESMRAGGALLRQAAEAAPMDRLVQRLWATATPEVSGCNTLYPCPERTAAWAKLEPDNGAAWVHVVTDAWKSKDFLATDAALAKVANMPKYDDSLRDLMQAWKEVFERNPVSPGMLPQPVTPHALAETTPTGMAVLKSMDTPIPLYQPLVDACNRKKQPDASALRLENCGKAGHAMLRHSSGYVGSLIGAHLVRLSGTANGDDVTLASAIRWQEEQFGKVIPRMHTDIDMMRGFYEDYDATGSEMETARRTLLRERVPLTPPADWQPTNSDHKPIGPLGEVLPSTDIQPAASNPSQQ